MNQCRAILSKLLSPAFFSVGGIMTARVMMLASKFLLSLFIIRFLGLQEMGLYGLLGGACAIVPMAFRMGVFSNIARQAVNQSRLGLLLNLRHYGTGIGTLYALTIPLSFMTFWHTGNPVIGILCVAVIACEHIANDIFVITNNRHRPGLANIILTLQSSGWIYLYMAAAYIDPSLRNLEDLLLFWVTGGILGTTGVLFMTRQWPWREVFFTSISLQWYKDHISGSWRIFSSELIGTVMLYLDRYMIAGMLSVELSGVYVLFWQVTNAICNLIGAGIFQPSIPRMVGAYKENDTEKFKALFKKHTIDALLYGAILCIGAGIIVPFMIEFAHQETATEYMPLLYMMLAATIIRIWADAYGYTLYTRHEDMTVLVCSILKFITMLLSGFIFIYFFGIYGSVIALCATFIIAVIFCHLSWKRSETL